LDRGGAPAPPSAFWRARAAVTAAITGAVAAAVFGLPIETGLLIGAVLAPTDPAILIPLFERLRVRRRVSQTIIAESALNDPTGAVLALGLAGVVAGGSFSFGGTVGSSPATWCSPRSSGPAPACCWR
jgi:NhaP-type Na+/H+ or K+/H+ antiporter